MQNQNLIKSWSHLPMESLALCTNLIAPSNGVIGPLYLHSRKTIISLNHWIEGSHIYIYIYIFLKNVVGLTSVASLFGCNHNSSLFSGETPYPRSAWGIGKSFLCRVGLLSSDQWSLDPLGYGHVSSLGHVYASQRVQCSLALDISCSLLCIRRTCIGFQNKL